MPLLETKGAGSAQGFGLSLGSAEAVYIEDVFSTYLYAGNGSTQTITNGIDLAGEGGLVWLKGRSTAGQLPGFFDTQRGVSKFIWSSSTAGQSTFSGFGVTGFGSSGFTIVDDAGGGYWVNGNGITYASWTFRKQPKFFDIVTYTGTGSARTIAHNLGSAPGCIMVKALTGGASAWNVYHRSLGNTKSVFLNSTTSEQTSSTYWNNTSPTSTVFTVGTDSEVNGSGLQYVAYLFAHDAGGFGLTGLDNVISCGSYTGNGSATGPVITLGYEPQWVMVKRSNNTNSWYMVDTMRGFTVPQTSRELAANTSAAEAADYAGAFPIRPLATGFQPYTADNGVNGSGDTYIYIAIRRGPMKVPTAGTSVYDAEYTAGNSVSGTIVNAGFTPDMYISKVTNGTGFRWTWYDRLRGEFYLQSNSTDADISSSDVLFTKSNEGVSLSTWAYINSSSYTYSRSSFRRAPGFFDVVCYTGTGSTRTVAHNLGVAPELIITKSRSSAFGWPTWYGNSTNYVYINSTVAQVDEGINPAPNSTTYSLTSGNSVLNGSGNTYVAYLFATLAGVSKVGSYTGTGTTQTINCGFTAGSRFVMIKRTDSTGDWYVWDSARGIVAGNDPYLIVNTDAAQVTSDDYIDSSATGFEISSTAPAINANGGTFIFLAIA